ncbi:MAG TPA: 50S ribosomal protein L21 [Anaerolineales bacterium]|nr:50S ribosomal protein L21 [Anaerolineales bacterium]
MKYAIVKSGSGQMQVTEGKIVNIDLLSAQPGDTVELPVILLANGEDVQVGRPVLEGVTVRATVMDEVKGEKILVYHYKPKQRYRVLQGHRQRYTRIKIDSIG